MTRGALTAILVLTATVGVLVGMLVRLIGAPPDATVSLPVPASERADEERSSESVTRAVWPGPPPVTGALDVPAIAARLNPTVVSIDARVRRVRRGRQRGDEGQPRRGTGTGFIFDASGLILTNHHVVDAADRLTVELYDGRVLRGTVVGSDPDTDVAVVRVEAGGPLEAAPLGNSDEVRVGDGVVAIGNPLAYEHTVTAGIVSFVGRKLFDSSLDHFIQTDAAIAMGNSGGPLIDARGLVIGITAAVSRQASNIGFAIPINQARDIVPQLLAQGRVSRGFMGITLRDVDPDLRQALALPDRQGALIQDVTAGSPGARAGLQPYDLVTAVDEGGVASNESLIRTIALRRPGTTARLTVYRDGRLLEVPVKLAERPAREERPAVAPRGRAGDASPSPVDVGLSLIEITEENAHRFDVPAGVVGLLVQRVEPLSEAFEAGIRRGQVLLELNRRPVQRVAAFRERLEEARRVGVVAVLTLDPEEGQRMIRTLRVDGR